MPSVDAQLRELPSLTFIILAAILTTLPLLHHRGMRDIAISDLLFITCSNAIGHLILRDYIRRRSILAGWINRPVRLAVRGAFGSVQSLLLLFLMLLVMMVMLLFVFYYDFAPQ
jgi:hypothetical protein